MQISPVKNQNFEKPSRNLSNRTKVKILKKKIFWISLKKIWFRVCSVTAEMLEHRNSGENRKKRSEIFFEHLRRAYKDLIQVKKKFKIISCLCTFNRYILVLPYLKAFSLLGARQNAPFEMTAWKEASSSGIASMSPWTNTALLQPRA